MNCHKSFERKKSQMALSCRVGMLIYGACGQALLRFDAVFDHEVRHATSITSHIGIPSHPGTFSSSPSLQKLNIHLADFKHPNIHVDIKKAQNVGLSKLTVKHTVKFRKRANFTEINGKHAVKSRLDRKLAGTGENSCTFSSSQRQQHSLRQN